MTMKNLTIKCALVAAGILVASLVSHAATPVPSSTPVALPVFLPGNTITNHIVIAPTNAAEFAELKAKEATLVAEQHALEQKIFKVFRTLHTAREEALKGDQELVELSREIARKQAELEKRTAEKYPDIGKQSRERDAMTKEHSTLGEQLRDVRKRMDVIQGLLPAEKKPATSVMK